jgi:hypothetical protein
VSLSFSKSDTCIQLPEGWDLLATHIYQKRDFLHHAEKYNPCKQRYYLGFDNHKIVAAAVVYTFALNVFKFFHLKSSIIGIPCSVPVPGIFGSKEGILNLKNYIFSQEKGFILLLNFPYKVAHESYPSGTSLPNIVLKNRFVDWNDYVNKLRSPYRRRLNKILNESNNIELVTTRCSSFDDEMYELYLQVFNKSNAKLEKLNLDFFRNLDDRFNLTICRESGKTIGWNITATYASTYYFFKGGIDYRQNEKHSTYFRLLTNVVKKGIEGHMDTIELGQTAEIPKMRLGGLPESLYKQAKHSNPALNFLLKLSQSRLSNKSKIQPINVFNDN